MRSFFAIVASTLLAGRVLAFPPLNITVAGHTPANINATDFLKTSDSGIMSRCSAQCTPAQAGIDACNFEGGCLCAKSLTDQITACEQCYFTDIVTRNVPKPDALTGSNPALGAYAAACLASLNVTALPTGQTMALVPPPGWLGPRDIILNMPETVVTVGFGGILGISAILILSNL